MVQSLLNDTMQPNLLVEVETGIPFDVRRFRVREAVQELFEVELEVVCQNADVALGAIIGQPATFTINRGAGPDARRSWCGLATIARQTGVEPDGLSTYELVIRPTLWALTQRRNYRIFQQISDVGIARALLEEWGIDVRTRLQEGAHRNRKFRVQYAENDFALLGRMLEDAGVGFYFETEGGASRLVLDDAMHARAAREMPIPYVNAPNERLRNDFVTSVVVEQRAFPTRYTQRDLDYRRPPTFPLLASASAEQPGILSMAERFHYVPGAFLFRSETGEPTPNADDKGKHRTDLEAGQVQAQKRLDAKRGEAGVVRFRTSARDVRPGMLICFSGHPRADLAPDRRLLVTASVLTGAATGEWQHDVEARSAEIPFRPALTTPKPKALGVESATVVGPLGEEIHTDEFGRVRVHFHWDREGCFDEGDSCWVPVSQPWGGAGYGGVNLPRIGQEVLVEFLGGDPDRPVVTGRVYTGLQTVPYQLPAMKTQSGWKSYSSPGTGGYNELMFEDSAGAELMRVQAERDRSTLVKNDCDTTVGRDETKRVRQNRDVAVAGNENKLVQRDRSESIGQSRSVQVGGDSVHMVGNDDVSSVARHRIEWNGGDRRIDTEQKFVAKAGNSSSYMVMTEGFIILQSEKVFINPGLEATLAALRDGTCPKTADEEAAAAALVAANRGAAFERAALAANRSGAGSNDPARLAPYLDGMANTDPAIAGSNALAFQMMTGENSSTISGNNLNLYRDSLIRGTNDVPPMTAAQADAAIDQFIGTWAPP